MLLRTQGSSQRFDFGRANIVWRAVNQVLYKIFYAMLADVTYIRGYFLWHVDNVQKMTCASTVTVWPQIAYQLNMKLYGRIAVHRIILSFDEPKRLFYIPTFLTDCTSCTAAQLISKVYHVTACHGRNSTYWNKRTFQFVFVVFQSIFPRLSPNDCNNKCIKFLRALRAEVNVLTSGGQRVSRE